MSSAEPLYPVSAWHCVVRRGQTMERRDETVFGEAGRLTAEELQLATRNHGLPLEALRYPLTPSGLHYLLIHYDIPVVDMASFAVEVGG